MDHIPYSDITILVLPHTPGGCHSWEASHKITSINRASLAQGNASLVLLNSSSIDCDLAQAHNHVGVGSLAAAGPKMHSIPQTAGLHSIINYA
jgi:hypothetical protein